MLYGLIDVCFWRHTHPRWPRPRPALRPPGSGVSAFNSSIVWSRSCLPALPQTVSTLMSIILCIMERQNSLSSYDVKSNKIELTLSFCTVGSKDFILYIHLNFRRSRIHVAKCFWELTASLVVEYWMIPECNSNVGQCIPLINSLWEGFFSHIHTYKII